MKRRDRKNKAAKHLKHFRDFHGSRKRSRKIFPVVGMGKPKKSIDELTDYEVDQIWAEAMHLYRQEGFDPEQTEQELESLIQQDPIAKAVYDRINSRLAKRTEKSHRKDSTSVKD